MTRRVYNFSAGPAAMPLPVLERAQAELTDWHETGMSVMEMSHRGAAFTSIIEKAERELRELLAIPDGYRVLFLQGGALAQNAAVPLNLMVPGGIADYVDTGHWSQKSIAEAHKYGHVNVAASSADASYRYVPKQSTWTLTPRAAYVHVTTNETIGGVEYFWIPDTGDVPLVADASSHILSRPLDVAKFGVIYAGAQKNIGPAGLTVVIVRDDLLGRARRECPSVLDYAVQANAGSMYNTPPTFGIYLAGLTFEWLAAQGGLAAIERQNVAKASALYAEIDRTGFYRNDVQPADRSRMSVPFFLRDERLNAPFLAGAEARGLVQLKGHRAVGGMRASIYNAMPLDGVLKLVEWMREFEREHG
ncbi:MAG TPA: 3-phosphoserine/phosphohydroxythreonine transaminase [Casimicrobiaceae bacterium]|jgi:phosphoserine aminotransferase|nr:3-phosphoserine/phosphohydroxythreonine transaminase [Casimicrobiaceae bacterium]